MTKSLKKTCRFVKGAKNAAIYDLANKKVYALNATGKAIVEDFVVDPSKLNQQGVEYINRLSELDLIEDNDSVYHEECEQHIRPDCRLHYVWLELTNQCNLRCAHCYGQFGSQAAKSENTATMTTEDWKLIIREIKNAGCTEIQLIGGEPLCFSGVKEVLTYAHGIGMKRIDVFTNATLLDENFIRLAKETRANLKVSLYGHDEQTHDLFTGVKGSFKKTENALKLMREHEIPTRIAITITKANESYIDNIKGYIESIGHKYSGYDTIRQVTGNVNGDNCVTDVEILKKRYRAVADFYTSEERFAYNMYWNSCWSGKLAITDSGDVLPCTFARDTVIGNILNESLNNVLDKTQLYWSMTLDQVDVCKDCEYRYACHNCRPLAMSIGENINSKEARCCYDPYKGIWCDIRECTKELSATNCDEELEKYW